MRKKSTRLLSAALAVCMMLSVLPVGAFAAEPGAEEQENGVSAQADAAVPEEYIAINEKNFPDENFRDYVAGEWDKDHDKYFSPSEIAAAKWITCDNLWEGQPIKSLKGIEYFTEIWELSCVYNDLTEIDLSHNKKLEYLNCHHNQLKELDVSGLPLLKTFYCGHNELPSIDVSKNEQLEDFDCQDNHLDTLNVSQNKKLVKLSCGDNNLTELDVSENKKLKELGCYRDNLSNLDLGNQTELEWLSCGGNPLSVLDVSANTKLKDLYVSNTNLTELNVSANKNLEDLYVSNTNLTSLDATNNTALEEFKGKDCSYNIAVEGDGKFDLTTLPGHFDASKATATRGGTINGNILTVDPNSKTFCYDYDIGQNNKKMNVVLNVHWHNYQWKHDGTKHWRECTTANCPGLTAEQVAKTTHDYTDATDPYCDTCGYVRSMYSVITGENVTAELEDKVLNVPVAADTKVHLTATVPEGKRFTGWTVKVGGEEADNFLTPDKNDPTKATFTMPSENVEVTANFASNPTLNPTLRVGDHVTATIEGSDASVPSGSAVPVGETVHLTATVPDGQHFIGWTVKVGGEEQKADTFLTTPDENDPTKVTFTMPDKNVEVKANFEGIPTLNIGDHVTANIEGNDASVPSGSTVPVGETVHLTATVPEGQHFTGWTVKVGDEEQKADTFLTPDKNDPTKATFTMPSENVEVTANFASNPTLNPTLRVGDHVTATIEGSDASVPSGSAVPVGETVHLTATVPDGQHFIGWTVKVGGEEQKADTFLTTPDENDPTKVTFTMPTENVEVKATFAEDPIPEPDPVGPSDTGNIQGAISAVVVGAAAGAIIYEAGTGIYRVINMPGIPMPSNRIELAELLWEHAGKPEPVSTALYSDIDEGDTDAQKAARWAVEQDLMKDDADNNKFHPAFPVSKLRTCLTWNAAKEKGLFDKTEE